MSEMDERKPEAMTEFERGLTRALRHVEVKAELTTKFLAIAAQAEQHRKQTGSRWYRPNTGGLLLMLPKPRAWAAGAMAALLALGVFGMEALHQRHERESADQQFALSMQIEQRTMEHTRQQLEKAGVPLD